MTPPPPYAQPPPPPLTTVDAAFLASTAITYEEAGQILGIVIGAISTHRKIFSTPLSRKSLNGGLRVAGCVLVFGTLAQSTGIVIGARKLQQDRTRFARIRGTFSQEAAWLRGKRGLVNRYKSGEKPAWMDAVGIVEAQTKGRQREEIVMRR